MRLDIWSRPTMGETSWKTLRKVAVMSLMAHVRRWMRYNLVSRRVLHPDGMRWLYVPECANIFVVVDGVTWVLGSIRDGGITELKTPPPACINIYPWRGSASSRMPSSSRRAMQVRLRTSRPQPGIEPTQPLGFSPRTFLSSSPYHTRS